MSYARQSIRDRLARSEAAIDRLERTYRNRHAITTFENGQTGDEEVMLMIQHDEFRMILEDLGRPQPRPPAGLKRAIANAKEANARMADTERRLGRS